LLALGFVVGVGVSIMHLVSEGALIEGVASSRRGGELSVRTGLRVGWSHAGVVLRVNAMHSCARWPS
jgi:hypothetical protein